MPAVACSGVWRSKHGSLIYPPGQSHLVIGSAVLLLSLMGPAPV